jgi:hypothetical protein
VNLFPDLCMAKKSNNTGTTKSHRSPHIRPAEGSLHDYNGVLRWSVAAVQGRYVQYCRQFKVDEPDIPRPREHTEGKGHWIYPIMESVIAGLAGGGIYRRRGTFRFRAHSKIKHGESIAARSIEPYANRPFARANRKDAAVWGRTPRIPAVCETPSTYRTGHLVADHRAWNQKRQSLRHALLRIFENECIS